MPVQYERTARAAGNAIILIQKLKFKSQIGWFISLLVDGWLETFISLLMVG